MRKITVRTGGTDAPLYSRGVHPIKRDSVTELLRGIRKCSAHQFHKILKRGLLGIGRWRGSRKPGHLIVQECAVAPTGNRYLDAPLTPQHVPTVVLVNDLVIVADNLHHVRKGQCPDPTPVQQPANPEIIDPRLAAQTVTHQMAETLTDVERNSLPGGNPRSV